MDESAILESVFDYLDGKLGLDTLEASLLDTETPQEGSLNGQLIGVLAEASHAHWAPKAIREAVVSAIYPFLGHENHVGVPRYLPGTQSEVHEITSVAA